MVPCMAQGVSGKVKERMEAAASGTDGGARPMLLFPEVKNRFVAAFVLQGLLLSDPCLQCAAREPQQTDSICFHSRVEHFLPEHQCSLCLSVMARYTFLLYPLVSEFTLSSSPLHTHDNPSTAAALKSWCDCLHISTDEYSGC